MTREEQRSENRAVDDAPTADHIDATIRDVSGDAQVAVGKQITQTRIDKQIVNVLRTSWRQLLLFFGPVFLGLGAIIYLQVRPEPGPSQMSGGFNIAVAPFELLQNQRMRRSEHGQQVAVELANRLGEEASSFPIEGAVEVWGPDWTGAIRGTTVEERQAAAQSRLAEIKADILVYGYMEQREEQLVIHPTFAVGADSFRLGQEVAGPYQLGTPIVLADDNLQEIAVRRQLRDALNPRIAALTHLVEGLSYFKFEQFDEALGAFQQAAMISGWPDVQGKEVVYLFQGNAYLNLERYEEAHEAYETALELNPEYARAYVGKGFTYFQEALAPLKAGAASSADEDLLRQAEAMLRQADAAGEKPPYADIESKIHFGLGRVLFLRAAQGEAELWEAAQSELQAVVEAYERDELHVVEFAAQAYGVLGVLHYTRGEHGAAVEAFRQAATLTAHDEYRAEYEQWVERVERES